MSGLLQFGIRLDRERFVALLARLGNPHQALRCAHVAGTNGKGSTCIFVSSVLRAAGYRVGTYLSPYVYNLRERIQIDNALIPPDDFARWVTLIEPHIVAVAQTELGQTTEFELKTAVALCYFAEQKVDFAVLEVGIGGRLDATNVIPPPLVAAITSISLDHTHILGDTVAAIAREKAGILKTGTMGVTAVEPGPALDMIMSEARDRAVPLHLVAPAASPLDAFVRYDYAHGGVTLHTPTETLADLHLRLRGPFQAANAAVAAACVAVLREKGVRIPTDALRRGLETASLPGRFEVVRQGGDGPALVLDVAHNEDGGRVLADALESVFPGCPVALVVGMTRHHDPGPFLARLAGLPVVRVVATAPAFRPLPASETADAARSVFGSATPVTVVEGTGEAIAQTFAGAARGEVVVVTGSLYVVGATPPGLRGK